MALADKLEIWQNDLLDMSRSNNLLYYHSTGRGAGIQFQVPDVERLFTDLAFGSKKSMPLDRWTANLEGEDRARALARIRARAREDLNDRGLNTLYLAFGTLEWHEADQSTEVIRSPLVLVPVELTKQSLVDTYTIEHLDEEEITVNPTLHEKLSHDFKVELPRFATIEQMFRSSQRGESDGMTRNASSVKVPLSFILQAIEQVIPAGSGWTIAPEIHLNRFFFQKLVMYQDLLRHRQDLLQHRLLCALGGERGLPRTEGLISAAELDQRVAPQDMLEILDADSSQQEALVAAKAGASFVLQGPPGTGKSQTIANIIAEMLALGRRVLFVSEKMAALEVVRQRLDEAGIGDFCLDLHNPKSDKKAFLKSLETSVYEAERPLLRDDKAAWQHESETLRHTRQQLNQYVRELHVPRFTLQQSAFYAAGKLAELNDATERDFSIAQVETLTLGDLDRMKQALEELSESREVLDQLDTYPWHETLATTYTLELAANISDHFGRLGQALDQLDEQSNIFQDILGEEAKVRSLSMADSAIARIDHALGGPLPPRAWLVRSKPQQLRPVVLDEMARSESYHAATKRLDGIYDNGVLDLDHASLTYYLTSGAEWAMVCLCPSDQLAQDMCLRERQQVEPVVTSANVCLEQLLPTAQALAEACHTEPPATLRDVEALGSLAYCLLETPQPPASWLDPKRLTTLRVVVEDARVRYTTCARIEQSLAEVYQLSFFDLDIAAYAQRFREQYGSLLRYFKPAYYRDLKALRSVLLPGITRSAAQIEADLSQAIKLLKDREWIRDHRIECAQALEHWFDGERTDWERIDKALAWIVTFHDRAKPLRVLPGIVELVTGDSRTLGIVRARHEHLLPLWTKFTEMYPQLLQFLSPQALTGSELALNDCEVSAVLAGMRRFGEDLRRFWAAADELRSHRLVPDPEKEGMVATSRPLWSALCEDVVAAEIAHTFEIWHAEHARDMEEQFGPFFTGHETAWDRVMAAIDWCQEFLDLHPGTNLPESLIELVSCEGDHEWRNQIHERVALAKVARSRLTGEFAFSDTVIPHSALPPAGETIEDTSLAQLKARIDQLITDLPCLERWLMCAQRLQLCRDAGLDGLIDSFLQDHQVPRDLIAIFERRFYTLWLDQARQQSPVLATFRGETRERTIARFRDLDIHHLRLARRRVHAQLVLQRHTAFNEWTEHNDELARAVKELKRQVQLKRHQSIRQIVQRVAPALLELRPCWMMSPLSISQYLQSGRAIFDLVIFDEASQVCAEEAICAILRGKQVIIVGDSKQLPPTRFFAKSLADSDDDDEEASGNQAENERVESILNECLAADFTQRSLRWHYRSRHESLIAFSNHHFYHDDLITFPSPDADHDSGVRFLYVSNGIYDRGKSRTNRHEAERVADLVFEHMRTRPSLSLGVVALSGAQQQAIKEVIETRLRQPEFSAWAEQLDEDNPTGFFVKNLESVQGDERDVIVLSIGYGRDADERIRFNFGPVNRPGGERRLNVAVTRARQNMILVSSMHAEDLPADSANPGVRTLRDYLEYAERGPKSLQTQAPVSDGTSVVRLDAPQFDSPFEAAVYTALQAKGLDLDTQVGCSGYRIDLAVRDPNRPGIYSLGIECDGRTYHSSHTARDRDRLRQRHLEKMGWRIHRIWSSDWISNPAGEVSRVLDALHNLPHAASDRMDSDDHDNDGNQQSSSVQIPTPGSPGPIRQLPPSPGEAVTTNVVMMHPATGASMQLSGVDPGMTDVTRSEDGQYDILALLRSAHLEFIDNRQSGGRLWVLGSAGLAGSMAELRAKGFHFMFARQGGQATRNQPAWYLTRISRPMSMPTSSAKGEAPRPHLLSAARGPAEAQRRAVNTCETCGHFMSRSDTMFQCGRDGTLRTRAGDGKGTPGCSGWMPLKSNQRLG